MIGAPRRTQSQRLSARTWPSCRDGRAKAGRRRHARRVRPRALRNIPAPRRLPACRAASARSRSACGAMAGGRRKPSSSPWVMITPPIRRVETPQLVVWQKSMLAVRRPGSGCSGLRRNGCPRIMRGAGLQRLAVLHHRFDGIGAHRAGETLILRLLARDHRHGQHVFGKARDRLPASCRVSSIASSLRWHGRYGPPARGIRWCAGTGAVRISQRTTLAHWLISSGRSR